MPDEISPGTKSGADQLAKADTSLTDSADIRVYLAATLGDTRAGLTGASAVPYLTAAGKIDHRDFLPSVFRWPDQTDDAVEWIIATGLTRDGGCART